MDPKVMVKRSLLFNAYVEYCIENRQAAIGQTAFTRRVKDMGKFSETRVGGKDDRERGWRGLTIDVEVSKTQDVDFGGTLGGTLGDREEPLSSAFDGTLGTLKKPTLANYEQQVYPNVNIEEYAKKTVPSVPSAETDSVFSGDGSVPPSVPPGLSDGTEVMRQITRLVQEYGIEGDRTFALIAAKIEDQNHSPELVDHCIKRYRQGHRIHIPARVIS